jgi:hypothetical protein
VRGATPWPGCLQRCSPAQERTKHRVLRAGRQRTRYAAVSSPYGGRCPYQLLQVVMHVAMPNLPHPRHNTPLARPTRRRIGLTTSFQIDNLTGILTSSPAGTGTLTGFDLRVGTHGSTLAGLTDALATAASLALQQGAPLSALADEWQQTWFVPNGPTDDPEIPHTTSLADYLARRLSLDHPATPSAAVQRTSTEHTHRHRHAKPLEPGGNSLPESRRHPC